MANLIKEIKKANDAVIEAYAKGFEHGLKEGKKFFKNKEKKNDTTNK